MDFNRPVRSLLDAIERFEKNLSDFIESPRPLDEKTLSRMASFNERDDLGAIDELIPPGHPRIEEAMIRALAPHYFGTLALTTSTTPRTWSINTMSLQGEVFVFQTGSALARFDLPTQSPLEIKAGPTEKIWSFGRLPLLPSLEGAKSFLFRPTQNNAFVVSSRLAPLWIEDHLNQTLRLINKAFAP